jgi:hypothetical protein
MEHRNLKQCKKQVINKFHNFTLKPRPLQRETKIQAAQMKVVGNIKAKQAM